ncbi:type II secretion system protein [Pseudoruegeria sp. SHC-113]|uniref:type II secretion system protein n=1 Tax=Pseudoruegeria sp. SHC-113 TaxID=2855439 RepID=UPI0021BAD136|nr:type II secretion system protein [Pseudoruegeria sp. SHC-113]MCT8161673.1 type II secretion system protein [Pseudoruegeria sp. SHC-113]
MPAPLTPRPPAQHRAPKDAGLTLVELIVAVLVLSIALVGILRLQSGSRATLGGEAGRTLALIVAQNRAAERLLPPALQPASGAPATMASQDWTIEEAWEPTAGGLSELRLTVSSTQNPSARAALVAYIAGPTP